VGGTVPGPHDRMAESRPSRQRSLGGGGPGSSRPSSPAGRSEPPIGLPRLRVRGALREIRASLLLAERRREDPRAERELQHTAARSHQQRGDHLHAMEHLAAAGDSDQLIEVAHAHGLATILSGRARGSTPSWPSCRTAVGWAWARDLPPEPSCEGRRDRHTRAYPASGLAGHRSGVTRGRWQHQ
jgi:hypothetical protein